jgi:hypothetical protein
MKATESTRANPSYWQLIFLQSKVNDAGVCQEIRRLPDDLNDQVRDRRQRNPGAPPATGARSHWESETERPGLKTSRKSASNSKDVSAEKGLRTAGSWLRDFCSSLF